MINICCVLKSGGIYTPAHVSSTKKMVERNVSVPFKFHCFSDMDVPDRVALQHGWPGWWSKLEIFRLEQGFYIDLDCILLGNIDPLLTREKLTACRDSEGNLINSSVMAWTGDYSYLIDIFKEDPEAHMREHLDSQSWGDQGFIGKHVMDIEYFGPDVASKTKFPRGVAPTDEKIIFFHGHPKPFEKSERYPWAQKYYEVPPR